jgi:hypothetical protein
MPTVVWANWKTSCYQSNRHAVGNLQSRKMALSLAIDRSQIMTLKTVSPVAGAYKYLFHFLLNKMAERLYFGVWL